MMDMSKTIATCSVVTVSIIFSLWLYKKYKKVKIPSKWLPVGKVSELLMYPMKSGYRMNLSEAECTYFGFKQISDKAIYKLQDRFLVPYKEADKEFRTGRTHPKLISIHVSNHDSTHVALDAPGINTVYVKIPEVKKESIKWLKFRKESIEMIDCGDEAASWLSRYVLDSESGLRLGFHDESMKNRWVNRNKYKYYPNLLNSDMGIFSDLSAYMLMNNSSVDDLNARLENPSTTYQFRPNIIVENALPYAEDNWKWIKIGEEAIFYNVKPCTRCVFTTIDSETCVRSANREPLKTLILKYRQIKDLKEREAAGNSPLLGINLGLRQPGKIKAGDIIYVGVE